MARDNWVHIDVEMVKVITEKAMLVVIDGEDVWLPISHIAPADVEQYEAGDQDCSMCITEWIAEQKRLR